MDEEFRIDESRFVALPTKEELLKICFDKEVHGYLQVCAYLIDGVEPAIQTGIAYGLTHNPRDSVSIQIAQGAKKDEVPRLLSEVGQALDEDWHFLQEWYGGVRPKIPRHLCGNRRPRFKFPIRHYRRRNRERIKTYDRGL
jgi:hypothetical protein